MHFKFIMPFVTFLLFWGFVLSAASYTITSLKGVPEHPDVHTCHCGKECASYAEFKVHLSSHLHSHFPSQEHSSTHGSGHSKERKWKCSMCPQAFISPSKLHVHFMGHIGMKPHKCDFCSKAFSDPSNLRTHLKIHTGK